VSKTNLISLLRENTTTTKLCERINTPLQSFLSWERHPHRISLERLQRLEAAVQEQVQHEQKKLDAIQRAIMQAQEKADDE